jgi:carbon storage regulator
MLVLSRKLNEKVIVNGNITITVISIRNNTVRLGIEAPSDIPIVRDELVDDPSLPASKEPHVKA